MGASPSKVQREAETIASNTSKESHMLYDTTTTATDDDEDATLVQVLSSQDYSTTPKKEASNAKTLDNVDSPRTKQTQRREGGHGRAQSRVDRQLAKLEQRDDTHNSHISDDQVHVNLAMADLMAYLQVVANNSNNLPLTRRDDPELGRMVSTLTLEEYARKSAAFVPADVRVIGGTFTKYGRVWDLPTSDEYNASDGAQEPGRSYGGACSNSLLKVLYDAANDAADAAQTFAASEALFDDDDDESLLGNPVELARNSTFASLDMNDHANPSTITWASLLRKMKAEICEIEYAQMPTITSTRKFDLNTPFSFVPENFDSKKGKKRSLLIGCNYNNIHGAELKASHDDVRSMKDYIVNVHGFPEDSDLMTILIDDDDHNHPTHLNITEAFKSLSEQSLPGDAVIVQFSGHGGRVLDSPIDSEAESYDEVIAPSDYAKSGLIRDTLIFKTLLAPMRYGVTVTILIDSCDTGMVVDLPYGWSLKGDRPDSIAKMNHNDDFSFVRFLKVVKTLYESSTFTQLGRTVGSALGNSVGAGKIADDEDSTSGTSQRSKDDENEKKLSEIEKAKGNSIFSVLQAWTVPQDDLSRKESSDRQRKDTHDTVTTIDTRDAKAPASLLEQVISCAFPQGGGEIYSDDDGSYDDDRTLENSTFDSEDYSAKRDKRDTRGRSRRRRQMR